MVDGEAGTKRNIKKDILEFFWILFGMNLTLTRWLTMLQLKELENFILDDERHNVPIGPRANLHWLYIVPWGKYKAVTYVRENYGSPIIILAKNGMDQPSNDTLLMGLHDKIIRINFYKSYIAELKRAMKDGAIVIGYFAWSLLDNFECRLGYTSRFGLVYMDFDTYSLVKASAKWFKKILKKDNKKNN
ncbi:beta-glucosidase 26-like [Canna indica]|uniref:Beta-glucosidase 26-like n=1 Tax=Canna indica TaxID=4628 RepID=A0AAQ3Q6Q5_9LILI|nr:beta-glucosidase 26-like [Canna indica]